MILDGFENQYMLFWKFLLKLHNFFYIYVVMYNNNYGIKKYMTKSNLKTKIK